jgi:hypothetical protein
MAIHEDLLFAAVHPKAVSPVSASTCHLITCSAPDGRTIVVSVHSVVLDIPSVSHSADGVLRTGADQEWESSRKGRAGIPAIVQNAPPNGGSRSGLGTSSVRTWGKIASL